MSKISHFKYVLGIQSFATADSGACIIKVDYKNKDYEYVAISEERLLRKKYPYTFPLHSIKYCMEHFNISSFKKIDLLVSDIIRENVWLRSGPSYNVTEFDYIKSILKYPKKKIFQINHHLAHAASVYYTSGFKNSAILIIDGNGTDLETNSFYQGKNKKIKLIDRYKGQGIGALYNVITKDCLNLGTGGEGKTMGLAPYGKKNRGILNFSRVKLEGIKTDYSSLLKRQPYSDILTFKKNLNIEKFVKNYGKRRINENILKRKWSGIAFDLQNETERCMVHLGRELFKKTKSKNICIAGGVGLNSVGNQKLFEKSSFKDIFVYPACSDAGIPFGLAIWGVYNHSNINKKKIKLKKLTNAYTGTSYNRKYINSLLKKHKIKSKSLDLKIIAKHISEGKIIGWFQNGSEYGPRALGNRSILADSRSFKMRNYVNEKVKHRENFRPFAPAVLEEDFIINFKLKRRSPYMLLVAKVKNPKLIPAVNHVDRTARVQTVNKKQNHLFYNLIKEFKNITGIGCILNTSFNDAGEPIVETPEDALITFIGTKIDFLVLGNNVIERKNLTESLKNKLLKLRKIKIAKREQKAIELLTKNYNKEMKKKYIKFEERKAYWSCLEKPLFNLEMKVADWLKQKKKILIYGTYDQTNYLYKNIKDFKKLNVMGFLPYKILNDDFLNKKKIYIPFNILKEKSKILEKNDYDILISSFEYLYDIEREINKNMKNKKYFKFYNGYSRNLISLKKNRKFIN